MKKLSLAVAVAATLGAGIAGAYTVGVPADGVLVPNVIHNGPGDTTAVAITNHNTAARNGNYTVYWTFFDQDSNHVTDGQFTMTQDDLHTFIWSEEAGVGLEGERGYLVFGLGEGAANSAARTDGLLSAAAFQANAVEGDAVFVPTFPVDASDWGGAGVDLRELSSTSLRSVMGAAPAGHVVDMRYAMGDFSSKIVLWATGNLKQSFTVHMYNDEQQRKSVNFDCENTELCFVDPTGIVGRPADFVNGFIRLATPTDLNEGDATGGSFLSYTEVKSSSFGATQTILNTHFPR
ncbi:MAG: hypothetical protein WCY08_09885 [Rhodocyclaceae bacterium]